jgi:diacylglycerol kinase (ATP)
MEEKREILAIINPISGTKNKNDVPAQIERFIDSTQFKVNCVFTEYAGHAKELAAKAVNDHMYGVIAIGGDGTVNEVASSLCNSDTALAVVPSGSGNGLARHLNIPLNVEKAIAILNENTIKSYDYCTVNDRAFFCTCGVGFDAQISNKFAEAGSRGFLTYIKLTISEYFNFKPQEYVLEINSNKTTVKAFSIACCNASQYGNDAYIAPSASMQDGLIDVVILHPFNLLVAPVLGVELFNHHIDRNSKVSTLRTNHIIIHREKPDYMHIDGEPLSMPAELEITNHPNGIKIFSNK